MRPSGGGPLWSRGIAGDFYLLGGSILGSEEESRKARRGMNFFFKEMIFLLKRRGRG